MSVTPQELYETYNTVYRKYLDTKIQLKNVRNEGRIASEFAWNHKEGSIDEKREASRVAWAPFNRDCEVLEQTIEQLRSEVDTAWNAYDDARIAQ
jgi:predicted phosphatase